ncbi:hypothetical protein Q3G72_000119 [Acer saccharum]|nr:hypothetical protein Q3G72_000119 [Acer saccharum]
MSGDDTVSDPLVDWTSSDMECEDDGGIDSGPQDVDRLVTIEDPSKVVSINTRGMLEQGVVRAMASMVEHPEYVKVAEASTSGRPLGILDKSPTSLIMEENLRSLRVIYGFRFPVPQLVRRMLVYYDLAPGQLMLNTWRILLSLGVLCERRNVQFGLGCLFHNYYLKEHVGDQGLYMLVLRSTVLGESRSTSFNESGIDMDFLSYIWIRRSFEILGYNMRFLSPLTDIERRFAVTSMASAQLNLPDKAESIKLYMGELAKKRVAVAAASKKK